MWEANRTPAIYAVPGSSNVPGIDAKYRVDNTRPTWGRLVMESGQSGINSNYGNGHVQEVVKQAHEELRLLLQQRADVMKRIGTVKQTIAGLANLFGDNVLSEELLELVDRKTNGRQPGFTKACRMILMEAGRPLSAREVCDQIQERIPPMLARHKDPMASVTTVLNRLVEYGEAQAVLLTNGRRAWRWIAEPGEHGARTSMAEPVHL
jgi:hypothetical protein